MRYTIYLLLMMALASLCGCADEIEGITPDEPEVVIPENPGVYLKTKGLQFDATGTALGLNVRSVGGKWQITKGESCEWIEKISPAEGEAGNNVVGVTLTLNDGMEERSSFLILKHLETNDTLHIGIRQYTHESQYNRASDSLALVAIKKALTSNEEWINPWDFKKPITTWNGVGLEEIKGEQRVTSLNTREYQIYGELPNEIGNLRELKKLIITGGSINGRFPNSLTSLRKLEEINIPIKEGYAEWFLPENMQEMRSLKILNVGYLKIPLSSFQNLYKVVTLESIAMKTFDGVLPEGIPTLINLKTLDMSTSKLTSLPEDFGNLLKLENLNLNSCGKLLALCDNLGQISTLKKLQLSGANKLESLPETIGQLQNLNTIYLQGCAALRTLPESFCNLSQITSLNLSNCSSLEMLPAQFGQMQQLTDVDFSSCEALATLPESFSQLSGLTKLNLRNCSSLAQLPQSIGDMQNVTEIEMTSCNALLSLPESLGKLNKLKKFTITTQGLVSLPATFGQLTQLEEFNCLKYSPDGEGISGDLTLFKSLTNLKLLKANYNSLSGDVAVLAVLPNLTTIELGANKISKTLDLAAILTAKLTTLNLSDNGLTGNLNGITQGIALQSLNLANNKIDGTLPEDINKCSKMTKLDLQNNQLTGNLPKTLIDINFGYSGLVLKGNNMSGTIASEILNSSGWKSKWYPTTNIIPQNPGYGFSGF